MSKLKKALARAKASRNLDENIVNGKTKQTNKKSGAINRHEDNQEALDVVYTRTKVLDIDVDKLKENKIFSHIKNYEVTDQINILRTQVLNKLNEIDGNTLMVTSVHPGEGKTFTSINLGISIAQELDRTVLLVDCDLRDPAIGHFDFASDFFGVKIAHGLSDYLLGQAELTDILLNPGIPRLTILPGGKSLPNSAELLGSARMKKLVEDMKHRYGRKRVIIFDSPSLLKFSDPLSFSRFVDGVLLVVQADRTNTDDLKKVVNLLGKEKIIGTILNQVKHTH